jgi:DNA-binding NarL/FixJ family response regulator
VIVGASYIAIVDHSQLSTREQHVLQLASEGLTNKEVAERLGVTVHAIKFHLSAVYRKLGVGNRTAATAAYLNGVREADQQPARLRGA